MGDQDTGSGGAVKVEAVSRSSGTVRCDVPTAKLGSIELARQLRFEIAALSAKLERMQIGLVFIRTHATNWPSKDGWPGISPITASMTAIEKKADELLREVEP